MALYRVLQEALTNVARHANAQHVSIRLHATAELVTLRVADDGCGFDAASSLQKPPPDHGMGLIGMRERVATYGGTLTVESRPGAGTQLELTISLVEPIEESEEDYGEDPRLVG